MTRVTDNGMTVSLPESNAFEQGSTKSTQYAYNKNGAMTMDLNKKITDISYNVLNLPHKLVIDSITHSYTYAADGRKLRVQQGEDKRDYAGSVIYEDSSLKRVLVDGGYAEKEGDSWKYYFYFNDHLGNNVVVADRNGNAVQNNNYYPFGLPMATASDSIQGLQPYKYNGKEFERKDGLKLYDYGARHYDAQVGRFMTVDPMAEKYYSISPYAYCANNPMRFVDPDGKQVGIPPVMPFPGIMPLPLPIPLPAKPKQEDLPNVKDVVNDIKAYINDKIDFSISVFATVALPLINFFKSDANTDNKDSDGSDNRTADDPLPRDKDGNPVPDAEAAEGAHTQLGTKQGRKGPYRQAREFDEKGNPVRDIDFTDHGRPQNHPNPHQHKYKDNPTGGTKQRSKTPDPLNN